MEILIFIGKVLLVGFLIQFFFIVLEKFGLMGYFLKNVRIGIIRKVLECKFCFAFWLSLIIGVGYYLIFGDMSCLFISPFVAVLIWLIN